jgi:hypothetical protein
MRTNRLIALFGYVALLLAIVSTAPCRVSGQTSSVNPSGRSGQSDTQWSVKVDQVEAGNLDLAYSFQIAIYENLVTELNKTKQFQQVFREGDVRAGKLRNLLVLKTTVQKYTPGSETRRAVTTVSGATKLTVRSQLVTSEDNVVFERTVNGNVRFFGSNLRATHNLAHNLAKAIRQSSWSGAGQPTAILTGQL